MNTNDNTNDKENDKENDINKGEEPIKIPEIDYSKMFKELTYLNSIKTYVTYINTDNEIETINQSKLYLNGNDNMVMRNQLIEIIKNSQKKRNIRYKLISIMVYNIHVTPESLSEYIETPDKFISLYTLNRIDTFELKPTMRLLKKYNGIYFFFFECPDDSDISTHVQNINNNRFLKNNNTKRINIYSKYKQKNKQPQNKQPQNKTKRYDRYVNML